MRLKSGATNVSSSGTAVRLSNTNEIVTRIYLSKPAGNTSVVYFGDSTVEGSSGVSGLIIVKGTAPTEVNFSKDGRGVIQFKELWVDAATNGDDLMWLAVIE